MSISRSKNKKKTLFPLSVKYSSMSGRASFVQSYLVWDSHDERVDGCLQRYVPQLNLQGFLFQKPLLLLRFFWLATVPGRHIEPLITGSRENPRRLCCCCWQAADAMFHSLRPGSCNCELNCSFPRCWFGCVLIPLATRCKWAHTNTATECKATKLKSQHHSSYMCFLAQWSHSIRPQPPQPAGTCGHWAVFDIRCYPRTMSSFRWQILTIDTYFPHVNSFTFP